LPTYDYRCGACSHQFEHFQSMKDKPLRKCPKCAKLTLERLIGTGAAVIFKGSGFYQTDYRSEAYKKAAEADAPKSAESTTTAPEAKPESTPAKPTAAAETSAPKQPASKSAAKPSAKPPAQSASKPRGSKKSAARG
jgi:putative FmdB family regulatory protein